MSQRYADIIIDISHEGVDRTFEYIIPDSLQDKVGIGRAVEVPFGRYNKLRTGYIISIKDKSQWPPEKLKTVAGIPEKILSVDEKLVRLADWMRQEYGSTMISALKTVMPVKEKVEKRPAKVKQTDSGERKIVTELGEEQKNVVDGFTTDYDAGIRKTYLLHGITGSGKTEVYIRMAEKVTGSGKSVIVLVPEIALTFQTVARFRAVFGERISILNSRLSKGERYREFERARKGETDIIIGPRSALFVPFENIGLIIIDEEHDSSYKSETTPKYHTRDVAIARAAIEGASVVLGSATPSISSYYKAETGEYELLKLTRRNGGGSLAEVSVVDMREELHLGNRSIISDELRRRLEAAFGAGEQAMVFLNRRGYNSFVSCRECGNVIRCPRCDVSLSLHKDGRLICHYCGHTERNPSACPKCSSKLIGGYGTGTEKVELEIKRLFPEIRTLRMDRDTTQKKDDHGRIIEAMRRHEADCLIGTQMIVKGHDFPSVTVAGAILADLGLFDNDYESAERTFDLLCQAAGRAGRSEKKGYVIIQTYQPEHYAIATAAEQDYEKFYQYEMAYRRILKLPPACELLGILISSKNEQLLRTETERIAAFLRMLKKKAEIDVIGPSEAYIYRIDEVYRMVIYVKSAERSLLAEIPANVQTEYKDEIDIQYDFNPIRMV